MQLEENGTLQIETHVRWQRQKQLQQGSARRLAAVTKHNSQSLGDKSLNEEHAEQLVYFLFWHLMLLKVFFRERCVYNSIKTFLSSLLKS